MTQLTTGNAAMIKITTLYYPNGEVLYGIWCDGETLFRASTMERAQEIADVLREVMQ